MQQEIDMAVKLNKPIIGVMPYGSPRIPQAVPKKGECGSRSQPHESQRIPQAVQDVADEIVGWNTVSIVRAIRHLTKEMPRWGYK
jgi:hypothetical protein